MEGVKINRHAYLIIAHNNFYILEKLILLLDDKRNDIYIHIDKKVKEKSVFDLKKLAKYSSVFFLENRIDVRWGDSSQVSSEIELLKSSINNKYNYYHLLSGVDLPIKNQDYIHKFFEENSGTEFIGFNEGDFSERVKYYHIFQKAFIARNLANKNTLFKIYQKFIEFLSLMSIKFQKKLGLNRCSDIEIKKGSNWFSITHNLANYIVENEKHILNLVRYSHCADEIFLQTMVNNSPYIKNIYGNNVDSNMRLVDWKRGNPYVFKDIDFNQIKESDKLFARKFDMEIDKKIIDKIFLYLKNN